MFIANDSFPGVSILCVFSLKLNAELLKILNTVIISDQNIIRTKAENEPGKEKLRFKYPFCICSFSCTILFRKFRC